MSSQDNNLVGQFELALIINEPIQDENVEYGVPLPNNVGLDNKTINTRTKDLGGMHPSIKRKKEKTRGGLQRN